MHFVRCFETALLQRAERGEVSGPVHTAVGQEAVAATVARCLGPDDHVLGSHRSHHHFLVRTLTGTLPASWDPLTDPLPETVAKHLAGSFAEIMGLTTGVGRGAGGSMHLRDAEVGFTGSTAIVGGGVPLAAGLAFAQSLQNTGGCAVCFIGDGAVNQGTFHETANLAKILNLPLLIVVENNGYAEATRPAEVSAVLPLATQGSAHGLRSAHVPGDEVAALLTAARTLVDSVRAGEGPALLEVETYRHLDHTGGLTGSTAGYRNAAEEETWLRRDPLASLPRVLLARDVLCDAENQAVAARAYDAVTAVFAVVDSTRTEHPEPLDPVRLLRAPGSVGRPAARRGGGTGTLRSMTFQEAVGEGIARALRRTGNMVFLGEEVAKPGGVLARTGRLDPALVGTRILDMPISEAAFTGLAGGAAMAGVRPLVELMYGSFALVAADQLFNHIGIMRALYGNTAKAPVVVRTKVPTGLGYGPQHGLNPVGLFASFPGWRVHAPADAREYVGVLNSALEDEDPVLIVEFSPLYDQVHELSEEDFEARLPLEGARVLRTGDDVSLFTYGLGVSWAAEAAERLSAGGVRADVVDLRALDLPAMDWTTLEESVRRTRRAVFVDPAARSQALGPRLAAELHERAPGARLTTLACADVQPVARELESQAVLGAADVVRAALRLIGHDSTPETTGEEEQ
ncbi:alpha-ketoacid dehydrogenase subunit alpha/beta [Streptomyces sp. MBT53]|uniref:dehydrogenase E1 component subunit alpha/beta n=1 Tax=Streptomyces sp. MBT53 TaxID=1488384 RepID=UPI001914BBA9|nr:alpha-ketoacid dehydrogenase subunit alpha/beta [Streptomyces sp. MBT53]MBK6015411.1 hypothetical protein [Streptomyces sp. MBT53]